MNKFDYLKLRQIFSQVFPDDERPIVIQSGLWSLIKNLDCKKQDAKKYLLEFILEYFDNRTILMPSFTPNFPVTKKFDIYLSRPSTGLLPTYAIKEKIMTRTLQPMTSFIVRGKDEKEVHKIKCKTVWGEESILGWLEKKNAIWCTLGLPWSIGCAFFHRAEEIMKVPYRYFKKYNGKLYNNGKFLGNISETKYSYSKIVKPIFNFESWPKYLYKTNKVNISNSKNFHIETASTKIIVNAALNFFSTDIYAFVKNKKEVSEWVKNQKNDEIENLDKNEKVNFV